MDKAQVLLTHAPLATGLLELEGNSGSPWRVQPLACRINGGNWSGVTHDAVSQRASREIAVTVGISSTESYGPRRRQQLAARHNRAKKYAYARYQPQANSFTATRAPAQPLHQTFHLGHAMLRTTRIDRSPAQHFLCWRQPPRHGHAPMTAHQLGKRTACHCPHRSHGVLARPVPRRLVILGPVGLVDTRDLRHQRVVCTRRRGRRCHARQRPDRGDVTCRHCRGAGPCRSRYKKTMTYG